MVVAESPVVADVDHNGNTRALAMGSLSNLGRRGLGCWHLDGRHDKDRAGRDVEQTLGDAPDQESGDGGVAAAPHDDQIRPSFPRDISDLMRGPTWLTILRSVLSPSSVSCAPSFFNFASTCSSSA